MSRTVRAGGTGPAALLLSRARDSLEDARLLAEHRRSNEVVLTRLALHQALQAVSLAEGLDADDGLRLDTLFRRVPEDHPQAERIMRLRDDAAQTIAAVSELVEALSAPAAGAEAQPGPERRGRGTPTAGRPEADTGADRVEAAGPRRDLSGPTALAASPQGAGRAAAADSVPSTAFWALMDHWRVTDLVALALIGHGGGLTRKGTRPRFRLSGGEPARYAALRRLDTALDALGLDPGEWLATPRTEAGFGGDAPLAVLQRDGEAGARQLLHLLNRQGLAAGAGGTGLRFDRLSGASRAASQPRSCSRRRAG